MEHIENRALFTLSVGYIVFKENKVILLPNKTMKHTKANRPLEPLIYHHYPDNEKLWIVKCLQSLTVVDFPPSYFGLLISFFNLIGQKSRFIRRERSRWTKEVAWSSTFLRTIFQHRLTFFDNPVGYVHA